MPRARAGGARRGHRWGTGELNGHRRRPDRPHPHPPGGTRTPRRVRCGGAAHPIYTIGRLGQSHDRRRAQLCRAARADRGPVLRGRAAQPRRHPVGPGQRHRDAGSSAPAGAHRVEPSGRRLQPAARGADRPVALRRRRRLLGRHRPALSHAGPAIPQRLPGDGPRRDRALHDHLPRLVRGSDGARALQSAHRPRIRDGDRVHVAALFRRCVERPGVRASRARASRRRSPRR